MKMSISLSVILEKGFSGLMIERISFWCFNSGPEIAFSSSFNVVSARFGTAVAVASS